MQETMYIEVRKINDREEKEDPAAGIQRISVADYFLVEGIAQTDADDRVGQVRWLN